MFAFGGIKAFVYVYVFQSLCFLRDCRWIFVPDIIMGMKKEKYTES